MSIHWQPDVKTIHLLHVRKARLREARCLAQVTQPLRAAAASHLGQMPPRLLCILCKPVANGWLCLERPCIAWQGGRDEGRCMLWLLADQGLI